MHAKISSAGVHGIDSYPVTVEVDISKGLPSFSTVGLPDASVKESKDRVVAAIRNSGFDFPAKRITVNLAPADIKKEGVCFDLPIAAGILQATGVLSKENSPGFCLVGELALDGSLRPVNGILPIALGLKKHGIAGIILPEANASEASVVEGVRVIPVKSLLQAVRHINGELTADECAAAPAAPENSRSAYDIDMSDVKGQHFAKRALEIAASGGHNILMIGPPGSGKTMLAKRLPTILPEMSRDEALETTKVLSVAGILGSGKRLVFNRQFRSPHHTVSNIALIGGGTYPRPGEVSLAHNGVLFLDELTEFRRDALEVLRQPLEDRLVTVSRARSSITFPASFMLVGAMNPCPCGNYGNPNRECVCTPFQIHKYRSKISGPLLDRIDIHIEVPSLRISEITGDTPASEPSSAIAARVAAARNIQKKRFAGSRIHCNAQMQASAVKKFCRLDKEGRKLVRSAIEQLGLSARAYDKILKISRTIADLDAKEDIGTAHIAEAVQFRNLDRGA